MKRPCLWMQWHYKTLGCALGGHNSISDTHLPAFCVYLSNWLLILSSLSTSKGTDLRWPCFGFLSSLCASALSCRHIFQGTLSLSYIWTSRAWEIILPCGSGDETQAFRHAKKGLYSRRSRVDAATQSLVGWRQDLLFLTSWFCLVFPGITRVSSLLQWTCTGISFTSCFRYLDY